MVISRWTWVQICLDPSFLFRSYSLWSRSGDFAPHIKMTHTPAHLKAELSWCSQISVSDNYSLPFFNYSLPLVYLQSSSSPIFWDLGPTSTSQETGQHWTRRAMTCHAFEAGYKSCMIWLCVARSAVPIFPHLCAFFHPGPGIWGRSPQHACSQLVSFTFFFWLLWKIR